MASYLLKGAKLYTMTNNSNQSSTNDAVLGGQPPPPVNAATLGGLQGVRQRLASGSDEVRIAAIKEAFKYGTEGLRLVFQVLKNDSSYPVLWTAYSLLWQRADLKSKKALQKYRPNQFADGAKSRTKQGLPKNDQNTYNRKFYALHINFVNDRPCLCGCSHNQSVRHLGVRFGKHVVLVFQTHSLELHHQGKLKLRT